MLKAERHIYVKHVVKAKPLQKRNEPRSWRAFGDVSLGARDLSFSDRMASDDTSTIYKIHVHLLVYIIHLLDVEFLGRSCTFRAG